ncbi:NAD(P)/FAD-dependent oxidoreductase [Aquicoccus sp. G2-2]|uniref:NAD(P)/FAD-dependent oxidoreductase n=1 Tax=Aquicoccus sp. G2-2 TaxID=3092120 RepID=UPI002ADF774B|nr:FAD-dependent oxidoreductase [Aquicoccus sp. G2-2]MEA1112338.1 FAD-dependent oxidoreductase [Aquicoccus sp. G2-2]
MSQPDAIIIGAGVIGAAVALEMARAGWKTLSLDRHKAAGQGSTSASCAIIRMHYSTLDGTALAWEGSHYWREWEAYLGLPKATPLAEFREVGVLVMKTQANDFMARHIETSRALGIPFEEWDAAKIKARLPIYDLARFTPAKCMDQPGFGEPTGGALDGAVFWPGGGYVNDPALSAQNLAQAAKAAGARFRLGVEVAEILQAGGRTTGVRLSSGEDIHAPVVINVAGPGSRALNELAGVTGDMTIETRPLRQEVVHLPAPEGFDFEAHGTIVSDSDIACYCRPEQGNHILVGSEDPDCDAHQWTTSDTAFNHDFTDQWTTQAMRYAQRVPTIGIPGHARGVVELYDAATDWTPIYDKSALPGFYMACGTGGNQYKNAMIAGKIMAALVEYCESGADHDSAPLCYRLPHIGYDLDLGYFSRKRAINTASSFSVLG